MADDTTHSTMPLEPDQTPDAPAEDPSQDDLDPGDETLTKRQVGRLIAAERKKARETVIREYEERAEIEKRKAKAKPRRDHSSADLAEEVRQLRAKVAFGEAAREVDVPRKALARLERMYLHEDPEDAYAWLEETVADLGLHRKPPEAGQSADPRPVEPEPQPPGRLVSSRAAPSSPPDGDRLDNPIHWSDSYVRQMVDGEKSYYDGVQAVRKRFIAGLRGVQLELPRGK